MSKIAFASRRADVESFHTREMAKQQTILLVDRDTDFLEWAKNQLQSKTARVLLEESSDAGYKTFCLEEPDLVLAEMDLHPFTGMELLAKIRKRSPNAMVILTQRVRHHAIGDRGHENGRLRFRAEGATAIQSQSRGRCRASGCRRTPLSECLQTPGSP
jgi:response regulator RpfG family c-di-GMP phosphodiesterase